MCLKVDGFTQETFKLTSIYVALGVAGGLFLTFRVGIHYLYSNQNTYFLYGLRLYDPMFIPRDWFTWEVFQHHFAFGYLLYFLQKLGPLHITTTVVQLVIMSALSFGILLLSKRFCKYPIPVFIALVTWVGFVSHEMGLGWQGLIYGYLQPSEISSSLMILGLALLFERRYLASGIVLGLAGLFHGAILSSYGPSILITASAVGIWQSRRSLLLFGLPLGVLWCIFVLVVGNAVLHSSPPTVETMSIMINFRNPGDLIIHNWPKEHSMNWLMWAGIGSLTMFTIPLEIEFRELRVSFIAAIVTVIISIVLVGFVKMPSLTVLMLWRVSPLVLLLGLLVALDRCIYLGINFQEVKKKDTIFIVGLFIAYIWLMSHGWGKGIRLAWLVTFPVSVGAGWIVSELRSVMGKQWVMSSLTAIMLTGLPFLVCYQSRAPVILGRYSILAFGSIVVFVLALTALIFVTIRRKAMVNRLGGYSISFSKATLSIFCVILTLIMICNIEIFWARTYLHNHFTDPSPPSLAEMEKWVRENTPDDSIFVIHPNMENMRIRARRAMVVDEKSVPQLPSDLKEWYQRISDVCGFPMRLPALTPEHIVIEGYRNLDTERARFLQKRYGADYVVILTKEHVGDISGLIERFSNDIYRVLEISPLKN